MDSEVHEKQDEDQLEKLQEISDLLLAAGYFRARLKALSYFDKIVGGLTWCLEMCSIDVDVDFLFRENLNIGDKIGITEKIVYVLNYLKCPYPLEPHQIQGLDAAQIFPVVQWLVKRAMENRESRKEHLLSVAALNYKKNFPILQPTEALHHAIQESSKNVLPERKYKRNKDYCPASESEKVLSTLMEYGYFSRRAAGEESDTSSTPKDQEAKPTEQQAVQKFANESRAFTRCVTNILHQQAAEITKAIKDYDMRQAEREGDASGLNALKKEKTRLAAVMEELEAKKQLVVEERDQLILRQESLIAVKKDLDDRRQAIQAAETGEKALILSQLRSLVDKNEELKTKMRKFKESCKVQMHQLEQRNLDAETSVAEEDLSKLQEKLDDYREKLKYLQKMLRDRNLEVSKLSRELDAVPARVELNQYQRRFTELGTQIEAKQSEYKGYYSMYNVLEDRKLYLTKELSLLTSIHDNFQQAMMNPKSKADFAQQMEKIITSVNQNKAKVEDQLDQQRQRRENFRDLLRELFAEEKHYKDTLKLFTNERLRYEQLMSQLNS